MDSLFRNIVANYGLLLYPINNSYKYVHNYQDEHTKFVVNLIENNGEVDAKTACEYTVKMLTNIYSDSTKCRVHDKDKIARPFERKIIENGVSLLWHYSHLLVEMINVLLQEKMDEKYLIEHNETFGCSDMELNYDLVDEINKDNLGVLFEKISRLKRVNKMRLKIEDLNEINPFDYIYDYLFHLYYNK